MEEKEYKRKIHGRKDEKRKVRKERKRIEREEIKNEGKKEGVTRWKRVTKRVRKKGKREADECRKKGNMKGLGNERMMKEVCWNGYRKKEVR